MTDEELADWLDDIAGPPLPSDLPQRKRLRETATALRTHAQREKQLTDALRGLVDRVNAYSDVLNVWIGGGPVGITDSEARTYLERNQAALAAAETLLADEKGEPDGS